LTLRKTSRTSSNFSYRLEPVHALQCMRP